MSREVSFEGANTEVFGDSVFDTEDQPLTLEDLGEGEHHFDNFRGLRRNTKQRKEKIINKRAYNIPLPEGTTLKFPYKSLANIVLGANKDVKFHRTLTSRANAAKYAANNRLRLGPDADFNNDGVNDVVLFDRYHNPVVINGFALANSEYPYKKAFYEANPKKSDQMKAGGYGNWVKGWIPANKNIIEGLTAEGFKKKSVREGPPSVRQNLNKAIKDKVDEFLTGANLPDDVKRLVNSILPWFQIFSILYDNYITDALINMLPDVKRVSGDLDDFKKLLKRKGVKEIVDNYLKSQQFNDLVNRNVLSLATIGGIVNSIIGRGGFQAFIQYIDRDFYSKGVYPPSALIQEWKEDLAVRAAAMKQSVVAKLNQKIQGVIEMDLPQFDDSVFD